MVCVYVCLQVEIQPSAISNIWVACNPFIFQADISSPAQCGYLVSIFQEYPDYVAYTTPTFFVDDWLNMYLDSHPMHRDPDIANHKNDINCADYRFAYMGAKGNLYFNFVLFYSLLHGIGICVFASHLCHTCNEVSSLVIITVI
jgi:hypothetical protein